MVVLVLGLPQATASVVALNAGSMWCAEDPERGTPTQGGDAQNHLVPTTEMTGTIVLTALGTNYSERRICEFDIEISGVTWIGPNPNGILNIVSDQPCVAPPGTSCVAKLVFDWTLINDPAGFFVTVGAIVEFDLRVDGGVVDSGVIRIGDPPLFAPGPIATPI